MLTNYKFLKLKLIEWKQKKYFLIILNLKERSKNPVLKIVKLNLVIIMPLYKINKLRK